MGSEWRSATLGETCLKITDGAHNSPASVTDGKPMASVKDLTRFGVNLKSARLISQEDFESLVKQGCKPSLGDVLIAKDGNSALDTVCSVDSELDAVLLSSVAILRPNPELLDSHFLKFYLSSPDVIEYLKANFISGAAIPRVVLRDFKKAVVCLPPLGEQKRIASIFQALDDRISLLRETNATLDAIAQTFFKSWFVDFDPVHANAGTQIPSLPPEIQILFPATFTDSSKGSIPDGWNTCPLDDAAHFLNGLALQKFPPAGDKFLPVIKIAQLRKGDTSSADRASRNLKPEYIIQDGDVLFSWSGSLEVAIWCGGEGALNQHLFKVTSDKFPKWFYFLWAKHHLPNFQQIAASKATTMGHIQRKHLKEALVLIPPSEVLKAADDIFAPLIDAFINNSTMAANISQLRDTLLPRLISGELRLPDVEQAIEEFVD
jgi:type I restriction enzyme, S subunit